MLWWKVFRGELVHNRSLTRVLTGNNPHPSRSTRAPSSPTLRNVLADNKAGRGHRNTTEASTRITANATPYPTAPDTKFSIPHNGAQPPDRFEDMLAKLRRTLIAARFSAVTPDRADPNIIRHYELACPAAAA
jgi:hypothetical protein